MTGVSIRVEGADELRRALRNVDGGMNDLKSVHADAGRIVERSAKPRARRRTGAMAGSIRSTGQAKQSVIRAGFASLGPRTPIQYFGWAAHNISPNPFIDEALKAESSEIVGVYERGVMDVFDKHGLV